MARWGIISLCACLLALAACTAGPVKTEFASDVPLRTYKTFDWLNAGEEAVSVDDIEAFRLDAAIRSGLHRELTARAYKYQTLGAPDFFVSYRHGVAGPQPSGVNADRSVEVMISDGQTRQVVWRGRLEKALPAKLDEPGFFLNEHLVKVVRQILNQFPPR